jgi:hypothetical protein
MFWDFLEAYGKNFRLWVQIIEKRRCLYWNFVVLRPRADTQSVLISLLKTLQKLLIPRVNPFHMRTLKTIRRLFGYSDMWTRTTGLHGQQPKVYRNSQHIELRSEINYFLPVLQYCTVYSPGFPLYV